MSLLPDFDMKVKRMPVFRIFFFHQTRINRSFQKLRGRSAIKTFPILGNVILGKKWLRHVYGNTIGKNFEHMIDAYKNYQNFLNTENCQHFI